MYYFLSARWMLGLLRCTAHMVPGDFVRACWLALCSDLAHRHTLNNSTTYAQMCLWSVVHADMHVTDMVR
jgi:hypothetical protein